MDAFEDLWNQVWADRSPVGPIEEFLVNRIVNAMWRLQRLARAETALFYSRVHGLKANRLETAVRSYEKSFLDQLQSPPDITDKPAHTEASDALGRAKYERDRDEVLLGRALDAAKANDACRRGFWAHHHDNFALARPNPVNQRLTNRPYRGFAETSICQQAHG
jgi:hypothetical protein